MNRAIIVLGHGSRSVDATDQFFQLVDILKEQYSDEIVIPAFMGSAEPRIHTAIAQAVTLGALDIYVIPCFLFQGIHIKEDIPEIITSLEQTNPGVTVHFGRPLGPDARIAAILSDRVEELL